MTDLLKSAKDQVLALTQAAYAAAVEDGALPGGVETRANVELPRDAANGDCTTTFALAAAKAMKRKPRDIAQALLDHMDLTGTYFASVEAAGPGFLNFRFNESWYAGVLSAIETEGADYGRCDIGQGERVMVEFVSANPTGPMHMGNARGGVLGDTLAAVLDKCGYSVWREFYVNDAGNQIDKFARSIYARCMQQTLGEDAYPFLEDGYQGDDIRELAQGFLERTGAEWTGEPGQEERWLPAMAAYGLEQNLPKMKADLQKYKIDYDCWFLESSLHASGAVAQTVDLLTEKGWTYEHDGALWLRTTELLRRKFLAEGKTEAQVDALDLKDDVLRRANGFYTYFAADIAYHRNKFEERHFDKVINIWGADHHGHVARLQAALDGLGLDGSHRLVIVLMQLVNLLQDGKPVRMSKRTGKAIALHDLLDEISVDAARYYFNARSATSPLDFDLGLAVREDSENPVYYVQYAHARICSLVRKLAEEGHPVPQGAVDMSLLAGDTERALIRQLANYCEVLTTAAAGYDPSYVNRYLVDLAADFHKFYTVCRIKGEEPALLAARLKLADMVRSVLANGMALLGVTAPEKM